MLSDPTPSPVINLPAKVYIPMNRQQSSKAQTSINRRGLKRCSLNNYTDTENNYSYRLRQGSSTNEAI